MEGTGDEPGKCAQETMVLITLIALQLLFQLSPRRFVFHSLSKHSMSKAAEMANRLRVLVAGGNRGVGVRNGMEGEEWLGSRIVLTKEINRMLVALQRTLIQFPVPLWCLMSIHNPSSRRFNRYIHIHACRLFIHTCKSKQNLNIRQVAGDIVEDRFRQNYLLPE